MKYVFDRVAKSTDEGFNHQFTQTFMDEPPWHLTGKQYNHPLEWFHSAQKIALALDINEAECAILSKTDRGTSFIFTFKNAKDYRAFKTAIQGDIEGTNHWTHNCLTGHEKDSVLQLVMKYLRDNQISATITNVDPTQFTLQTKSQLDYFAIMNAYDNGRFTSSKISAPPPPSNE
jgi:hypothetical protein